jgi:predicted nucleotidyltransferase
MQTSLITEKIRDSVREIDPRAKIILYGSRSRGDADAASDWDLLILVEAPLDDQLTDRIRHRLYELEWESGGIISSIVRPREEWNSERYRSMPFYQRIEQEGVRL